MDFDKVDKIVETDSAGRFLYLVIPKDNFGEELNLIGRKKDDLSLDEIIRLKKYVSFLCEEEE